ncbi:podocalyxin [Leptodactylus fuscus]|uniref:podocalyxin n=1 Tax=Leptodactylus fuscus TaxID=238119 RepID=UPI003F4E615E
MSSLRYLLLLLSALGFSADGTVADTAIAATTAAATTTVATTRATTVARTIATTPIPATTANQATTVVDSVPTVTANQPKLTVPTSGAITKAMTAATSPTPTPKAESPSQSEQTIKPPTTITSLLQSTIQATTVKTDTKTVSLTSTEPSQVRSNTSDATSLGDKSTQPTNLDKATTVVSNDSNVVVTSQPVILTNETKFTTSFPLPRTSEKTSGIDDAKNLSIAASQPPSTETPLRTVSQTTAGHSSEFTTGSPSKTILKTIAPVPHDPEIEVNCKAEPEGSFIKINIKSSKICEKDAKEYEKDTKEILKQVCTAIKPGYQPNKDECHIDFGNRDPLQLVIVDAYVKSTLNRDELYASLKHLKKDNSFLFQYDDAKYEEEDVVSIPLISAIVSLAVLLLIAAAVYGCWHQRQTRKREQRLTEELQTMENGYHDNPTLEVMETSPEMQEKKGGPNGELGDSWIVPLDNLTREDLDDEEDTHL